MMVDLGADRRQCLFVPDAHVLEHELRVAGRSAPRQAHGRLGLHEIDAGKAALTEKALDRDEERADAHAHARL